MFETANPSPDRVHSFVEAKHAKLKSNVCATGDSLSISLYSTFQLLSVLSYLLMFYYTVAIVVIA